MKTGRIITLATLLLAFLAGPALAAPDREGEQKLKKILTGLKQGIEALQTLGKHEEAERLEEIFEQTVTAWERKARGGEENEEVRMVRHRIEVLRIAMRGLLEAEKRDAAEMVEHRIRAYELALEGRRDEKATYIRKKAPKPGQMAEILHVAAELWADFGHEKKAKTVAKLAAEYKQQAGRGERQRGKGGGEEREMLARHTEILRKARNAFREAEKGDLAQRIEKVIHVYELALEGQRGEEVQKAHEAAPNAGQLAEMLQYASNLWREWGRAEEAGACRELGQFYAKRHADRERKEGREREHREGERERGRAEGAKLERIQAQLQELRRAMERLAKELEHLKREAR